MLGVLAAVCPGACYRSERVLLGVLAAVYFLEQVISVTLILGVLAAVFCGTSYTVLKWL